MILAAKIITVIIIIKGIIGLLFPGFVKKSVEYFNAGKSGPKRLYGIFLILLGSLFIYLTRVELAVPVVHWIVAITGIYIILAGLFILMVPGLLGKMLVWFYKEKGPTSLIGFIALVIGIVLYNLI